MNLSLLNMGVSLAHLALLCMTTSIISPLIMSCLAHASPPEDQLKVVEQRSNKGEQQPTSPEPENTSGDQWSVDWPSAPAHTVELDTDEGTWMSVDVSPDGEWIVFDLLGDIFRIPFKGGEAQLLRGGIAWEMQPRYSPDGKWIAFTSDVGGGDNLWVMSADPAESQEEAWAVTRETYRLVNSPAWTPDGRALIGRKHFTSRRSLGAGEMWRYHWRGSFSGVQLTKRHSEQKDEGEPAISPDGRWLYYSRDLSPGKRFEYNKDSHGGIYGIKRLDLFSGEEETLTGGPGGAARPTPSPDGAHLAFIRRTEGRSALWVRDLRSGVERLLVTPVERDLQETWAIHGVYPQIAWTPQSDQIIYWARGKLWRVLLESGEISAIPFHVRQPHRLITPRRKSHRIATESSSSVRMLRWVRRHQDQVVFQALGHLYHMDLSAPEHPPRAIAHHGALSPPRLSITPLLSVVKSNIEPKPTYKEPQDRSKIIIHEAVFQRSSNVSEAVDDVSKEATEEGIKEVVDEVNAHRLVETSPYTPRATFALSPSWSHRGEMIIYATWSDQHLGQIRALNLITGRDEELSAGPGHYLNPLLSEDEEWLIYQRVGGGWITPARYVGKPGLYALHLPSGAERRIAGDVESPHLGPDPRRVYFTQGQGANLALKSALLNVSADPHEPPPSPKVIAKGEKLQAIRISPDGAWIAFQSDFNLWVTPRPRSGRALTLSPNQKDRPIYRLSDRSGFDPQWSHDSESISWRLGATLMEAKLPRDLLARDPRSLTHKELKAQQAKRVQATPLMLSASRGAPQGGLIALLGGRLLTFQRGDHLKADLIPRGIVLIEGDRITQVGDYEALIDEIPSSATRINIEGHTVIPGLIDVHAHSSYSAHGITPQTNWQLQAALAFGVTTLHDPSHHSESVFSTSELAKAGLIVSPRLFSTGTILYGAEGRVRADIQSLDDARRHLARMRALGAFSVKSYNQPRREQRQQVLESARELDMLVVPEGGSLFHHNLTQIIDGHTGIEHAIPLERLYQDVIQLWSATEVGYTPTFNVAYGGLMGENYWYQESAVYAHKRLRRFVPPRSLDARARRPLTAPLMDWNHIAVARSARDLMRAGVRVQAGAHGQREGLGMHWEMWSMHQGGFTPYEALRAATLHGAMYLGLDQDLGRVSPGYLADLAIIKGDPLTDLRKSEDVRWVVLGGRVYDAQTMARLTPTPLPPPQLFFHAQGTQPDEATQRQGECGCHP